MRMVKVTVTYDMDEPDKPLAAELQDWIDGNVGVADIVACDEPDAVRIEEISQ